LGFRHGLTTPSCKTIIVEKAKKNSWPDPKIRRPKLWKKKYDGLQLGMLDDVEADLRIMVIKKMEAHNKRYNRMGRHHKGGKSPARAVKTDSSSTQNGSKLFPNMFFVFLILHFSYKGAQSIVTL
jgi:hypothetical protein